MAKSRKKQINFKKHIKSKEEREKYEQYKIYIAFSAIILILVLAYQIIFGV